MRFLLIFVLASIPLCALGSFCETIEEPVHPFHNNGTPMTTTSPFVVTSVPTTHQSEILTIRIKSVLSELSFGGFILHARRTRPPYEIVGDVNIVKFESCELERFNLSLDDLLHQLLD